MEETKRELAGLKARVERLEEELARLAAVSAVPALLRRRGLKLSARDPVDALLLDPASPHAGVFYDLLCRPRFRLFLRSVMRSREPLEAARLARALSLDQAKGWLGLLDVLGIVAAAAPGEGLRFAQPQASYHDTFVWFLAELFRRDFTAQTARGVTVVGSSHREPLDLLVALDGRLALVSARSRPARAVGPHDATLFLDLAEQIRADLAFLVVDTHLRIGERLAFLLHEEGWRRWGNSSLSTIEISPDAFALGDRIFLVTARDDLSGAFASCFRHALTRPLP